MTRTCWLWFMLFCASCSHTDRQKQAQIEQIAQSRVNLGLAYLNNKQWLKARQHLEKAVTIAPNHLNARMGLAQYLMQIDEHDQANSHYLYALKLAPDNPDLHNDYGVFLCHIGKYVQAEQAFLHAIKQKGYYKLSSSYENAGLCAIKFNANAKAKNWFIKALNHEPNRYLSTLYLSELEMNESAFNLAKQRLVSFHNQHGYHPSTLLAMIKLGKATQKTKQIEKYAQLLAKQFPHSPEYRQYLDNEF